MFDNFSHKENFKTVFTLPKNLTFKLCATICSIKTWSITNLVANLSSQTQLFLDNYPFVKVLTPIFLTLTHIFLTPNLRATEYLLPTT